MIGESSYSIDLVSASTDTATIKVTDSSGNSESKEVSQSDSKKVNGVTVAVTSADSNNLRYSASIIVGADKVTLTSGSSVSVGESSEVVDGTTVTITGGTTAATKIIVSVYAPESNKDFISPGNAFVDPVFGTFKVDFAGFNIGEDSTAREDIVISPASTDKMLLKFVPYGETEAVTVQFAKNQTNKQELQYDDDGRNITVMEGQLAYKNDYIVVGNEDEGHLVKVSTITNSTSGNQYSSDKVIMTDVLTGDPYEATITSDGAGTITIGGKVYGLLYDGANNDDGNHVVLNYPDSAGTSSAVVYPTIQTSKGAKIAFYEPLTLNLTGWEKSNSTTSLGNDLTQVRFPDGNGYTDIAIANNNSAGTEDGHFLISSTNQLNTSPGAVTTTSSSVAVSVGRLTYNFTNVANSNNESTLYLVNPQTNTNIINPALIIFEEEDDNSVYEALVVTLDAETSGSDANIGINDVVRTWGIDGVWDSITTPGDSKVTKEADLWGTIVTTDGTDSDQESATISYPDEQIYAQVYVAGEGASITAGTVSGSSSVKSLGSVTVSDKEVGSVSAKNLIVVGGSCVNSVAASLLDSATPLCGADWEAATGVGSNSFLIETFDRGNGKVATLVAGYNAGDTTNAAKALTTQTIDTSVGKKYTGSTASSVSLA
jgi:hypothetical protein